MKKTLTFCFIMAAQSLAAQQVVPVQSGAHEGYSRLVLQIDPTVAWEIDTSRGQATLRFPGQALSFATSRIFDRITRDRIASVTAEVSDAGSALVLALNCGCAVKSFAYNDGYIVLDVFDGPALPPEDTAATAQTTQAWQPDPLPFIQQSNAPARFTANVMVQPPAQPVLLPDPQPVPPPGSATLAAPALPDAMAVVGAGAEEDTAKNAANDAARIMLEVESIAETARNGSDEPNAAAENPALRARIEEAQTLLLAQLTRAADQGLVNFVPPPAPEPVAPEAPPAVEDVAAEPAPDPALTQQLSARTAYAQGTEDALTEIVNQFAMPQCLDDAVFVMEGWGGAEAFSGQLAKLRSRQIKEFDVMDPQVTGAIIRLYLRYGLGLEAKLFLAESSEAIENAELYRDMAYLLEAEPEAVSGPVLNGNGCGGDHEMWYLATGNGTTEVLDPLSITEAFANYPIEVRSIIGPPLAQAFIDRGQVDAGHIVLEIVRRAEGAITSAQRMAEARLLEVKADNEGAANIYKELAASNDSLAPDAMIAYARSLLEQDSPVPASLLLDLESASFMQRNTDMADTLRLWEIRVRAKVEGADKALAQIAETLKERPELAAELQSITAEILALTEAAALGDYTYAQIVLQYAQMLRQDNSGDAARLQIAKEMAKIGLPELALDVLTPNLTRANSEASQVVAAAYLQLFQPDQALAQLAGDTSLEAFEMRLQANLQREDYAAVARLLAQDQASEISVNDIALRAGDWAKIKDAGALGTLAAYMEQGRNSGAAATESALLAPLLASQQPSLKAARALLADNQSNREFLEEVLAETAPAPR